MLDVSMVLHDPMLSSEFDVRRQSEVVGGNGRVSKVAEWFRGLVGIVKPEAPSKLERGKDSASVVHSILVLTEFSLRDASFGFQPDVVVYGGTEYLVEEALPYQRLAGYTRALCTSTRATDNPPEG
jgi:hypothetical protein